MDEEHGITDEQIEAFLNKEAVAAEDDEARQAQFVALVEQIVADRGRPISEAEAALVWDLWSDVRFNAALYQLWTEGRITVGLSGGDFTFKAVVPPKETR